MPLIAVLDEDNVDYPQPPCIIGRTMDQDCSETTMNSRIVLRVAEPRLEMLLAVMRRAWKTI